MVSRSLHLQFQRPGEISSTGTRYRFYHQNPQIFPKGIPIYGYITVRDSNGNSLDSRQIDYVVKTFRGHRTIPIRILESLYSAPSL